MIYILGAIGLELLKFVLFLIGLYIAVRVIRRAWRA